MKLSSLVKFALCGSLGLSALAAHADEPMAAYLFSYFTGNSPSQEQISYAISRDGFNYTPMNNGNPVINSKDIALTGCVRDPHILRGEDGMFYMVATDMKSSLGWQSNHGLVLLKSSDLITWESHAIDFQVKYPGTMFANAKYVWAPQTIWDEEAGKYMIYFAFGDNDKVKYQTPYYVYANADFSDLEGEPQVLFDTGNAAIDMDIVLHEETQTYHLFYKDEAVTHGITQCTFAKGDLHHPERWTFPNVKISGNEAAEGSGAFPLIDGGWCLMWDCYNNGHYMFNRSDDLNTFTFVQNTPTKGAFTPRHGTVIQITETELKALEAAFPYVTNIEGLPTGNAYAKQADSGLHLGKKADGGAALFDDTDQQTIKLVPSTAYEGYYNIVVEEGNTPYYMQKYGSDGWTTMFRTDGKDLDYALWSFEDAGEGYIKFKNKGTGLYLGSDNTTSGSSVYSDKAGTDIKHKFYFEEASDPSGIEAVEADQSTEVYTVQGMRISAPQPGINIVVANGSATKVYVK